MPSQYGDITKSLEKVTKAIEALSKSSERTARRTAFDVDTLTNSEINELKLLIEHEADLSAFTQKRAEEPRIEGMYKEFNNLMLVIFSGGSVVDLSPMAYWAVEKYAQRKSEKEASQKAQWRHDRHMEFENAVINGVIGLIGVLVGFFLTKLF